MRRRPWRPGARIFKSLIVVATAIAMTAPFAAPCLAAGDIALVRVRFADLPGFAADRLDLALRTFAQSCSTAASSPVSAPSTRTGSLKAACLAATQPESETNPRAFFERHFQPFLVSANESRDAFFTGYYQPEVKGSLVRSQAFPTAVYALPPDLVTLSARQRIGALAELTAARRGPDGALSPYPDRGEIEDGALERVSGVRTLVFLRDKADLLLAQVQGSARVRLDDGRILRLTFAGRNGHPYTGLAKILVQRGVAPAAEMTMPRLLDWLRRNGMARGEAGDELLRLNRSFVFFSGSLDRNPDEQPKGGAGVPLTPLRSIAVDRHVWSYGLPFFIDADIPLKGPEPEPFRRLTIAQDTGSAIVGAARADIYFGLGDPAGARAGELRHRGRLFVLLPRN